MLPGVERRIADLARMTRADWDAALDGVDTVVNAAGALQDGGRDDLRAVHVAAVAGLLDALGPRRLVQVSAVGAVPDADTAFLRTKAEGDARVRAHAADWVVLRPGLVIGPAAYGGTALLRAAAALPVTPAPFPDARIQCVALGDVADAVVRAARAEIPSGTAADLVEPEGRPLPEVIAAMRRWLGLAPAPVLPVPGPALRLAGRVADGLAALGWRPPVRSTALRVLASGVTGDPSSYDRPMRPLDAILASMPATVQERWFARAWPLVPVSVAALSLFWVLSGAIGLLRFDAAAAVLTERDHGDGFARASVLGGVLVDVALGLAILWRPWARAACLGMAAVASVYLVGGTALTPGLWADPLGPLLKVLPAIVLPLLTRALLEDR